MLFAMGPHMLLFVWRTRCPNEPDGCIDDAQANATIYDLYINLCPLYYFFMCFILDIKNNNKNKKKITSRKFSFIMGRPWKQLFNWMKIEMRYLTSLLINLLYESDMGDDTKTVKRYAAMERKPIARISLHLRRRGSKSDFNLMDFSSTP